MNTVLIYIIAGVVAFLVILLFASYVKTSPQIAYIISGLTKRPKILIGSGGFRIPFFQKLDKVYTGQITVDVKTTTPVPTSDFINVDVDAVAKVRVKPTDEGIRLAAANFLNMTPDMISNQVKDVLQGNMREIVGTLDLRALNTDRDGFSNQIQKKAAVDMEALGIEILSCNIQSVTDREGLIEALGADNTCKITKEAAINKAQATKDVKVAEAKALQESNDARVLSETKIAEKNNELAIKKSELKIKEDIKRAEADAAYEIQKQEQQKEINKKVVEAEVEKAVKTQELKAQEIGIRQKSLEAEINKKADADKYQKEVNAAAELEQRKRKAEAETYEAKQKAEAMKAEAEAMKFKMEQEALGIRAKGEAEAYAILKKGEAEAEAMNKKADAYQKYNDAAVVEMLVGILPEVAKNVAEPMKAIDNVTIYGGGDGNGVAGVSANVPMVIKQTFDTVSNATGVDLSKILQAHTINAKTDRNISIEGGAVDVEVAGKQLLHD